MSENSFQLRFLNPKRPINHGDGDWERGRLARNSSENPEARPSFACFRLEGLNIYDSRVDCFTICMHITIRPPDVKRGMGAFRAAARERAGLGAVVFLGDTFGALDPDTALIPVSAL